MPKTNVDFVDAEMEASAPPLPEPTSEDGNYLDGDWLDALRHRPFTYKEAAHFLVETFPRAVGLMWCPFVSVTDEISEIHGDVRRVRFATGGWSGAEELIEIILSHFWMKHFHVLWRAGGLFIFDVPEHDLEAAATKGGDA